MTYVPDMVLIATGWQHAKKDAAKLAKLMNFVLLQEKTGPCVITTTRCKKRFEKWMECWSWLYQVWQDRQPRHEAIPMAILCE